MSGDDKHESSLALALSGGGFRATLFHLGSLTRLNELGILKKLQCVSSVSGGSIIGNLLGLRWNELGLDSSGRAMNFHDLIFHPIKKFCSLDIDLIPSLVNMASMLTGGVSQGLDSNFKKLYGESTLADLPDETNAPKFVTIGSNLQTTSRIYFSRSLLWDERLGLIHKPEFSISKIVSISTAFPPFLSPVVLITDPNSWRKHESSDLFDKSALRKRMVLTDGGIHDPSAVTPLIDDFSNILVSDGSSTKEIWRKPSSFWIRQMNRSILMQTVTNSENIRKSLEYSGKNIVWWRNSDRIDSYGIENTLMSDSETTASLGRMRTRLNRFSETEQKLLINWGYTLCDAAIKKHGGQSGTKINSSPGQLPD